MLFVSHNLPAILSLCNRAILLQVGQLQAEGRPSQIVQRYQENQAVESVCRTLALAYHQVAELPPARNYWRSQRPIRRIPGFLTTAQPGLPARPPVIGCRAARRPGAGPLGRPLAIAP